MASLVLRYLVKLGKVIYALHPSDATFTAVSRSFIALEDTRDGNVYTVARMTDGFCWMLENLRLDESATGINTNAKSQNGSSFTISQLPASTNSFGTDNTTIQYNKNNTDINNPSLTASYDANNDSSKWYGYGNNYTWAAARGTTSALSSGNTTTSICPANWRLPIGNSTANYSFSKLATSMGGLSSYMSSSTSPTSAVMSARLRHFPNNFVYSGNWNRTLVVYRGTGGTFKYFGYSARCVAGS